MANHEIVPTLSVHQGYGGFFTRLRLQRNVQCKFCHHSLLLGQGPSGTKTCNTHFAPPLSSASLSQTNLVKAHERECFGNIASLGAVLRQSPNMWRTMLSPSF